MATDVAPSDSSGTATTAADNIATNWHDDHQLNPFWDEKRRGSALGSSGGLRKPSLERRASLVRHESKRWWKFTLRPWDDEYENTWWFAGTAIPLVAATLGPLANVLSIAALVTYWRMCLIDGVDKATCPWDGDEASILPDISGHTFKDPRWCYDLNAVSLAAGFIGNIFLLFNFTGRVRYMIALPVTIFMWYLATGILTAITISMDIHVPPIRPQQTYTQGFWYAVIAAVLYMVASMLLMVNMLGYFLGHYPQQFNLTESQRTLILQTMLFFIWLAGGAGVFSNIESRYGNSDFQWNYVNSLYFCDVTILTVGFGDLYPTSNTGRGLVFPYSVGGIIMLGLMISSITKFAQELGSNNVLQKHVERSRTRTIGRAVTTSLELRQREQFLNGKRPTISGPFAATPARIAFAVSTPEATRLRIQDDVDEAKNTAEERQQQQQQQQQHQDQNQTPLMLKKNLRRMTDLPKLPFKPLRTPRVILLREEKDRFDAMRRIQLSTLKWKRWYALSLSIFAFGTLWCVGAVIFWQAERRAQGITYFQSLYLCYVSLLTIGYGDLAPKSNAGRPFFVVWSLVAVPTMTILVADMGDTIIGNFKRATFRLGDFTILPEKGMWRGFLLRNHWLLSYLERRKERKEAQKRLARGFQVENNNNPDNNNNNNNNNNLDNDEGERGEEVPVTIDTLAAEATKPPSDSELGRKLARAIRKTANDIRAIPPRTYSYEEWVEFTQLIRFTSRKRRRRRNRNFATDNELEQDVDQEEEEEELEAEEEGLVEWDWIGENSPMMARESEAEFLLDRLCESLGRYMRRLAPRDLDFDELCGGNRVSDGMGRRRSSVRRRTRRGRRGGSEDDDGNGDDDDDEIQRPVVGVGEDDDDDDEIQRPVVGVVEDEGDED